MQNTRIVTLLFTDVEGSTRLLGALGDAFVGVIERQRAILRDAAGARRGSGYPTGGDGCVFIFGSASHAVAAAVEAQRALAAEPWPGGTSVRVRMAIHAGEVAEVGDELFGMALHQASRIIAVTHGGQVVVTDTAAGLIAQLAPDISLLDLGEHGLRDIVRPVRLHQAVAEGIATSFPPLKSATSSEEAGFGPADAIGAAAASDAALQAGYAADLHAAPSPIARSLVRVAGFSSTVRLAPRFVIPLPGVLPVDGGPGWVRLRCAIGATGRHQCLERQGALLALCSRFGAEPGVLEEASCVTRGDAACDYVLHCASGPRWGLVVAAAAVALALGVIAGLGSVPALVLGAFGAALAFAAERWRAGRAEHAARLVSSRAFRRLVEVARAEPTPSRAGPPTTDTGREPTSEQGPVLEQEGDVWRVTYAGTTSRIRHSRGMALLNQLLQHPGEELHVQALDALVPSAGAGSEQTPVNPAALPEDGMSFGLGDAGPVLDDRARAEYRHRLAELRCEVEDAERCNDPGRAAAAQAEIEQLGDELRAATGLGGRARRASSDVDRIRIALTRRIRAAIEQLGKLNPALGEHLSRSVRTGFTCCYAPVEHLDRSR